MLPFSDIPQDSLYFEVLTELKKAGLVAGYGDGTFKAENPVSRAEAITFILRGIKESVQEKLGIVFPDVSGEAWYVDYVATAFKLGFVKGYPDGMFRPNDTVSLAEFFTMFFVAAKIDVDPQITLALPSGITPTEWYAPYLQEAIRQNILEVENNAVDPSKPLTRGDVAKILYRVMKLEETK